MGSERYLAVRLRAENPVGKKRFVAALEESARGLLGDAGAAALDLWIYDVSGDSAVIGCRRDSVAEARAALACVHSVEGRVAPRVVGVSGSIRKARSTL